MARFGQPFEHAKEMKELVYHCDLFSMFLPLTEVVAKFKDLSGGGRAAGLNFIQMLRTPRRAHARYPCLGVGGWGRRLVAGILDLGAWCSVLERKY